MTVEKLVSDIRRYAQSYYIDGQSLISDSEFDELVEQLRLLEPTHPILHTIGWGCKPVSDTLEVKPHLYVVEKFDVKVKVASEISVNPGDRRTTYKLDGGSVILYYEQGLLKLALTRGDGVEGLDVTSKLKGLAPTRLKDTFTGAVRGEVVMPNSEFAKYKDMGYKSARNLAVGMLMRDSINDEDLTSIRFVAYKVRGWNVQLDTKDKVLNWLGVNGFEVVDSIVPVDHTDDTLRQIILDYTKYPIDGLIITSNTYSQVEDDTFVQVDEVAYKTASETAEVVVEEVRWRLTRTGKVVPRVFFEGTDLSGATITKATAFNAKFVKEEGLGRGAVIELQRSGEVIPDIKRVVTKATPDLLTTCPECGSTLVWVGANLYCNNLTCKGKQDSDLFRWMEVVATVKNLGGSALEGFVEHFNINSIEDLYNFSEWDRLTEIDGIGQATVKLFQEFNKLLHTEVELHDFLLACNIFQLGSASATVLSEYYDLLLNEEVTPEWVAKVNDIKGVNYLVKEGIVNSIAVIRRNAKFIKVVPSVKTETVEVDTNKIFTLTGKLSVPRKELVKWANQYGWTEGPIKKARYLVTDNPESGSSKNKEARKLKENGANIDVISEATFRELLEN